MLRTTAIDFSFHIYLINAPFHVYSSIARDLRFDASQYPPLPKLSIKTSLWPPSQRLEFMWNLLFELTFGVFGLSNKRALVSSRRWDIEEDWPVLENLWQGSYTHMNFSALCIKYEPHTLALLSRPLLVFLNKFKYHI